jgi:diguanylate cyclase (GGDEF)-like protein
MPRLPSPKVLILSQTPDNRARWAAQLAESGAGVWRSPADVPAGEDVEVLLTDFDTADAAARAGGPAIDPQANGCCQGVAVIGIGACEWGDLRLKEDCSADELALACTLLAEVARLRKETARAAEVQRTISQLAYSDPLTGLPNRRAWEMQLTAKLGAARSGESVVWLAIVDLDGFKQVNDAFGLSVGDEVLRRVGSALAGALRRRDLIARLGGDEFGVLLADIQESAIARVFDRLRAAVASEELPSGVPALTASIGYASSSVASDASELFVAAERALRKAKSSGRDQAVHYLAPGQ